MCFSSSIATTTTKTAIITTTVMYSILVKKQSHGDRFLWQESSHEPQGTLQPAEHGSFECRKVNEDADQKLKDARRDLVELLETKGSEDGWTSRLWDSYRRLIEIEGDSYLPPWLQFQSFSDQVLEALSLRDTALGTEIISENSEGNGSGTDESPNEELTANESTINESETGETAVDESTVSEHAVRTQS